jgi:hypothetical protein
MSNNIDVLQTEDELEQADATEALKKGVKGHFFVVSLEAIHQIIIKGGLADDVMSYLVLARHTQGRGQWQRLLSTSGAKAIHTKTGIPYRKAMRSLQWLEKAELIMPMNEGVRQAIPHLPDHFGKTKTRATTVRWILQDFSEPLIYLANTLVDGVKGMGDKNPPLLRMMDYMPISFFKKADVRLDALMLLLHLYYHHELDEYGGVNPNKALYGKWEPISDKNDSASNFHSHLQKYTLSKCSNIAKTQFIDKTLFYISDEKIRSERFWNALKNLKSLGFVYEVIQIWDSNPLTMRNAEILYPLYILDRYARQSEPYLAKTIHDTLIKTGNLTAFDLPQFFEEINVGTFRYLAYCHHYPLGIFRLRFRPKVTATGRWLKSEINKVIVWQTLLSRVPE